MNRKSGKSSKRQAAGFTLIEALVGTMLLGSLLVGIVVARGQLIDMSTRAALRIEACDLLDAQLQAWWAQPDKLPRNSEGRFSDKPGWWWRTDVVTNEKAEAMKMEVVAVKVFAPSASPGIPSASVEVLLNALPPDHSGDAAATSEPAGDDGGLQPGDGEGADNAP